MQYISHYHSPLGDILLAADSAGLTGLWFEGQKYFALYLDKEHEEKNFPSLRRQSGGLTSIFRERIRISRYRSILRARISRMRCGRFSMRSPTDRPRPTGKSPHSWQKNAVCPACRPRPWAAPSDIMRSPSSCPVTGSWAPAEA